MTAKSVHVQGIEVTQAIQYYRSDMHLSDPLDRAPDNSARLVANKPAWVRVYVRSNSAESINNVSGSLRVEREYPESVATDLNPQPPAAVTAYPEPDPTTIPYIAPYIFYRWERSTLASTLNFVIPANLMCGYLRLKARVSAPNGEPDEMITLLDATLYQTIHFRAIMIGYKGKDPVNPAGTITVNPPTLADLQATSELTLRMYPISAAVYEIADTQFIDTPLGPSGCAPGDMGWANLQKVLTKSVQSDGAKPGCTYYGLIAPDVPGISPASPKGGGGCNWTSVAAGYVESPEQVGANRVMVHEIGHFFQPHAPCGNPDNADSNYPVYEPYGSASIGEYGLDINSGEVKSPETYKDVMSYCPPDVWESLYGHKLRINHPLLNPNSVCDPKRQIHYPPPIPVTWPDPVFPFVSAKPRPLVTILGTQDLLGKVTIEHVFRTISHARPRGAPTSLIAMLTGAEGQPLASAAMFRLAGAGTSDCGCGDEDGGPPFLVQALLPDVAPGSALLVLKDGEEIWRRAAPPASPRVTGLSAEIIENKRLAVRWRAESPQPDQLEYWIRWSRDRGETWNGLGTGITVTDVGLALEGLPSGELEFQVVVHDGFFSVASEPVTVKVPVRPPIITILHPREGATIPTGGAMRLWAVATGLAEEFDPDEFRWLVNDKEVGRGLEAWIAAPDAGEHRCNLEWKGDRDRHQRTVPFKTGAIPHAHQHP